MDALILGFIYSILAALSFAMRRIFDKKLSLNLSSWNALLYSTFFISIFTFILKLIFNQTFIIYNLKIIIIMLLVGFFGFFGILFLFLSFKKLKVGIILTIANTYPIINFFLVLLIYKETLNPILLIPIMLIIFGVYLITNNNGEKIKNKYLIFPFLISICWAFYSFGMSYLIKLNVNIYDIVFYSEFLIFIQTLIYSLILKNINLNKMLNKANIKFGILVGIVTTFGSLFINFSLKYINVAISTSIITIQILIASIFSYFIYKEKLNIKQIVGMTIMVASLALFYLLS